MAGRSTTEAIHLLRSLMEKYRERQRDLHMAFLDLEKAYDSIPRELVWRTLIDKGAPGRYLRVLRDMYEGAKTRVRTLVGDTEFFPVEVGLHQDSAISPYLFALILDEISKGIQEDIPWCMIFADDIMLIAELAKGLNSRLEKWRKALKDKGLRISRDKTEYLRCDFGRSGRVDDDVAHRIRAGWVKWRAASGVLCDKRIPLKLKGKFYRVAIRPAMIYGSECWPITKAQANRVEVAELRMLRWTCGKSMVDMIPNGVFRAELDFDSIIDKMREGRLRWFGHLKRRPQTAPVRRVEAMVVDGSRRRGRPKLRWEDRLKQDMKELRLSEDMTSDRNAWRDRIRTIEYGVSISIGYGVSSSLSNTAYSFQQINTAYPLPLDTCMTRSSTNELFTPYKEPEREFRSSRRHFMTQSLDELRSPDFNLLSDQEYSEEEEAEAMAETMEKYMSKTRTDYGPGVARPKIDNKDQFELKGQVFKELRENTFSDSDNEDANEHIQKVLEIVDLFHVPNITVDQLMLRVFPISLTGAASR
ncbi:ataxia telangiectasia mutated family protein [Tanacetum coccineum]